jgi:hypothetical protein
MQHGAQRLATKHEVNCLIQRVVKNLKPLDVFLNSMHQNKKVLWELWDKIRMNFSSSVHGHIQMHEPKQKGWLLYLESNWCMDKQWICMAHHNLYLGKDTTPLPIIYYVIFRGGYYKMEIFLVFPNGGHENVKLWILPLCRFCTIPFCLLIQNLAREKHSLKKPSNDISSFSIRGWMTFLLGH